MPNFHSIPTHSPTLTFFQSTPFHELLLEPGEAVSLDVTSMSKHSQTHIHSISKSNETQH